MSTFATAANALLHAPEASIAFIITLILGVVSFLTAFGWWWWKISKWFKSPFNTVCYFFVSALFLVLLLAVPQAGLSMMLPSGLTEISTALWALLKALPNAFKITSAVFRSALKGLKYGLKLMGSCVDDGAASASVQVAESSAMAALDLALPILAASNDPENAKYKGMYALKLKADADELARYDWNPPDLSALVAPLQITTLVVGLGIFIWVLANRGYLRAVCRFGRIVGLGMWSFVARDAVHAAQRIGNAIGFGGWGRAARDFMYAAYRYVKTIVPHRPPELQNAGRPRRNPLEPPPQVRRRVVTRSISALKV
jgi:hypothetical protein